MLRGRRLRHHHGHRPDLGPECCPSAEKNGSEGSVGGPSVNTSTRPGDDWSAARSTRSPDPAGDRDEPERERAEEEPEELPLHSEMVPLGRRGTIRRRNPRGVAQLVARRSRPHWLGPRLAHNWPTGRATGATGLEPATSRFGGGRTTSCATPLRAARCARASEQRVTEQRGHLHFGAPVLAEDRRLAGRTAEDLLRAAVVARHVDRLRDARNALPTRSASMSRLMTKALPVCRWQFRQ